MGRDNRVERVMGMSGQNTDSASTENLQHCSDKCLYRRDSRQPQAHKQVTELSGPKPGRKSPVPPDGFRWPCMEGDLAGESQGVVQGLADLLQLIQGQPAQQGGQVTALPWEDTLSCFYFPSQLLIFCFQHRHPRLEGFNFFLWKMERPGFINELYSWQAALLMSHFNESQPYARGQ